MIELLPQVWNAIARMRVMADRSLCRLARIYDRRVGTLINPEVIQSKIIGRISRRETADASGGLFGLSDQLKRLSECGDPLETMSRVVDFEVFRPALEK